MARADREAVLRGVNARFDEEGDDQAVIAALGTPTFAAVSVLRGYTPPEDADEDGGYDEEYQYIEPEEAAEPVNDAAPAAADVLAAEEPVQARDAGADEEAGTDADASAVDVAEVPEPQAGAGEALPEAEPGPVEDGPPSPEPEDETAPDEVNAAPEAASGSADDPSPGQAPPEEEPETIDSVLTDTGVDSPLSEPETEPEPEPHDEADPQETAAEARESAGYDFGLGTIEVYSDSTAEPPAPAEFPEAPEDEAEQEESPEPEPVGPVPEAGAEYEYGPGQEYAGPEPEEEFDYPGPEPERAKLRGGRVFASVLLTIVPGVPVGVVLVAAALALLLLGAAMAYVGGVAVSFAFLGMSVVADILLCVGFGLVVGALGLMLVFLAVWFFLRCVVGLYGNIFARMGAWCRGEEVER